MKIMQSVFLTTLAILLAGCATSSVSPDPAPEPKNDMGLFWVKYAAEYQAVARQVYGMAERALPAFVANKSWSALPGQSGAEDLPPAVILDIDETVIDNVEFQLAFVPPFADRKLEMWDREHIAEPVPGVVEFIKAARTADVEVFFLTNRPCEKYEDEEATCPQKQTVIAGVRELGLEVEPEFVSLSYEEPDWTKEKLVRRKVIGENYRVIMLFGDDLGDFVPCVRHKPAAPCARAGTRENRAAAILEYEHLWGNGWYILPNPMHGSWTSVR